jgi:hypothetical protein
MWSETRRRLWMGQVVCRADARDDLAPQLEYKHVALSALAWSYCEGDSATVCYHAQGL